MQNKKKRIIWIVGGVILAIIIILLLIKGCEKKEYVITFNANGGSNVASVKVTENNTLSKPEDPIKEGYIFIGWYLDDKLFDFSEKITKDITLEARWEEEVKALIGITLNATSLTLKPNGTAMLKVIFTPEGATADLEWSSSDEKIVTVNNGELKALKNGEVTITVTTKDGKYKATCNVKVEDNVKSVTSVTISGKKEVNEGSTIKLTANIKPKDATNKEVIWTSSDSKIATVDKNGNVKGIKSGSVTITVTTVDGEKKATINIIVKEKNEEKTPSTPSNPSNPSTPSETPTDKTIKVTGITASIDKKNIYVGDTAKISYTVAPTNATNKEVSFKPNKEGIVKIDANGNVTGLKAGSVTITITTKDGSKTAKIDITVEKKKNDTPKNVDITNISLDKSSLEMKVNDTKTLTLTIEPSNASIKSIEWKSSNTNVVTVNQTGNQKVSIKAIGDGTATITVIVIDNNNHKFEKTCTIKVSSEYIINLKKIDTVTGVFQYDLISVTKNGNAMDKSKGEYDYIKIGNTIYGERGEIDTVLSEDAESGTATIYFENGDTVTAKIVKN